MDSQKLEIVYEDEHLVTVNKPAGMLVHRSKIDKYESVFALQLLRDQIRHKVYPLHRLDKPTSGLLMFAKSSEIASQMQPQFTLHQVDKHYIAVVRGYVTEALTIDYAMREVLDKMTDNIHKQNTPQTAVTHLKPIATLEIDKPVSRYKTARFSLVELCPQTGRKHQLRRHMKHIFHPIVGDTTHGDGKQNAFAREHLNCHRLLLHAHKLSFKHPVSQEGIELTAELDSEFSKVEALFK